MALHLAARRAGRSGLGPLMEIGAYLGRSTLFLAAALPGSDAVLYSVDHHHGSEEMQQGWPAHDPSLVAERTGLMDSLPRWREAISAAGAEDLVVGVVGDARVLARHWHEPLGLLFIDGGHSLEQVRSDYHGFARHVAPGGLLVFHDIFPDGLGGGEAPYLVYLEALAGGFAPEEEASSGSLRVLRRESGAKSSELPRPPARRSSANSAAAWE
jgi:MMP 1-O-methyltransferase